MKKNIFCLLFFIIIFLKTIIIYSAPECRCHSKNSSMRRMHEMIGFKNCGNCHKKNKNLMTSQYDEQKDEKYIEGLKKRLSEDKFCIPCHNSDGTIKKEIYKNSEAMKISDTYFCPVDKLRFPEKLNSCPKCGGKLININFLMEESKKNPSNKICRECHPDIEAQNIDAHITFKKEKLNKCLDCHADHDDCGNCHR